MRKLRILITGGGIAGSFAALLFGRDGHEVHVVERRPLDSSIAISNGRTGNFTLSERGRQSLKMAGLLDRAMSLALPLKGRMVHLPYMPVPVPSPYGAFDEDFLHSISRHDLHAILLNEAMATKGVHYLFEHGLVDVDPFAKEAKLSSPDGEKTMSFDLFIGADGVKSASRTFLVERGWMKVEHLESEWCYAEEKAPKNVPLWQREYLQVWPRKNGVVCGLPMLDGSMLLNHLFRKEDMGHVNSPIYNINRLKVDPWYVGESTLLIGDAAHSMSPFMGQGMNMALEDAAILAKTVREAGVVNAETLKTFQVARQKLANAMIERSEEHSVILARKLLNPVFIATEHIYTAARKTMPFMFGRSSYNAWTRGSLAQ